MALNQQLEDDNTVSELNNSSEDEPTRVSDLIENSRNEIHPSKSRILQLCFLNKPSLTVLTGKRIEGEGCTSIEVALIDGKTGKIVKCGHESSAKVEIVVLKGDFNDVEGHDWTTEEFNKKIVKEIEGKKSLLTGDAFLNLKEGVGTVGKISFTHNKSWMKKGEFRLGARVVDNFSWTRVRGAISEPFTLKDCRSAQYGKHYPPSLSDEVWRLVNIGKGGAFHNRLSKEKITTVKDFLTLFYMNPQRLHDILGAGTKMVEIMIDHAQTCVLETEKDDAHKLVVPAFEHRKDGCGLLTLDGMDFIVEQPLCDPGEVPSSPGFDPSCKIKDFDEYFAQIRWGMLFNVLQWVKIRRSVGITHVQKKQRCC